MAKCQYCGRERRCIGGYYYPVYEECACERRAQKAAERKSEEYSRNLAEKQATCSHEWHTRIQDNYGYHYCPKCGATKP